MESRATFYYGIDVSKDTLCIALAQCPIPQGKTSWALTTVNNQIEAIISYLECLPAQSHVIFEATGTYSLRLRYCLDLYEIPYSILSPRQSSCFAWVVKSFSQDDARDAALLAYYGSVIQPAPTANEEEKIHQLRQKRKHLQDLKHQLTVINNRIHALSYDPRPSKIVLEDLQESLIIYQEKVTKFEAEIYQISDEELRNSIEKIQTIKGIGPVVSHQLVIATNGFKDFGNVKQVAKFLGLIGKTKESGTSVYRKSGIIKTGKGPLRAALYMAANCARRFNPICKELYERLRANGKCHKVAIIAVAHKLVRIAFAIVKKDTCFQANFAQTK